MTVQFRAFGQSSYQIQRFATTILDSYLHKVAAKVGFDKCEIYLTSKPQKLVADTQISIVADSQAIRNAENDV